MRYAYPKARTLLANKVWAPGRAPIPSAPSPLLFHPVQVDRGIRCL